MAHTLAVVLLGVPLAAMALFFALDRYTVGGLFPWPGLGLVLGAFLVAVALEWLCARPRSDEDRRWINRRRATAFLVILVVIATGAFVKGRVDANENAALLADARREIEVTIHGDVSLERVDQTLVKFQGALTRLRETWPPRRDGLTTRMEVYPGQEEFVEGAGAFPWSGGFARCAADGVEVHLPAEAASAEITGPLPTRTPEHEAVHVALCEAWGPALFQAIPRWFHEGAAEFQTHRGLLRLPARVVIRLSVWDARGALPPAEEFCAYRLDGPPREIALFYGASFEMVRFLHSEYGEDPAREIVALMEDGASFEEALREVTGHGCEGLYRLWRERV